jgi:alkylhydroperoxidase family enzyme
MTTPPKPRVTVEADPFIPYVAEGEFDKSLDPIVGPYMERMGFLPNALKLYAHRPEIAVTLFTLNSNVMRDPSSTLPQLLKRKVAAVCCAINGCAYCTAHSCAMLKRPSTGNPMLDEGWNFSEDELQSLFDGTAKPADEMERSALAFARAASEAPAAVPVEILEDLRKHLTPPQVVELACVVGFWKFYNTVHDSLHIPIEQHLLGDTGYVDLSPQQAYRQPTAAE